MSTQNLLFLCIQECLLKLDRASSFKELKELLVDKKLEKRIGEQAKLAVVKIYFVEKEGLNFRGTGFFISPNYVLTAYHCIGNYSPYIVVGDKFLGNLSATLEQDKSLPNPELDIAVLKITSGHVSNHYLPLTEEVTKDMEEETVITWGYPSPDGTEPKEPHVERGIINSVTTGEFRTDAVHTTGQSGSPIYHHPTHRVIGIAKEKAGIQGNHTGWATTFNPLFLRWNDLKKINTQSITFWENKIRSLESEVRSLESEVIEEPSTSTSVSTISSSVSERQKDYSLFKNESKQKESNISIPDEIERAVLKTTHELCSQAQNRLATTEKIIENLSERGIDKEQAEQTIDALRCSREIQYHLPNS